MKILHLRTSNFYGGPERQLHFHARLAKQENIDITIASFEENNDYPEFLKVIAADDIKTHTFEVSSGYDLSAIKKVRSYLQEENIDILATHDYRTHAIAFRARKQTNTKWLAFSRGYTNENIKIKVFHSLDKAIIRTADHIIAVSESQRQKLMRLRIAASKISTIHNAIDVDHFAKIEPLDIRSRFNLPADSFVIVSGGRFSQEKGQRYLIDAAFRAHEKYPNLYYVLFGDGPDYQPLLELVKKKQAENYIFLPGHEKNLPAYLQTASLLVNPSLSEGLPNIVLEGMAAGTPVLVTNVGGHPEIITDGYNGALAEPAMAEFLAFKIVELSKRPSLLAEYKKHGIATIKEKFSFTYQNEQLIKEYRQLLND